MITLAGRSTIARAGALLTVGLMLSACGGAATGTASVPPDNGTPIATATNSNVSQSAEPVTGHVGDTLTFVDLGGDEIDLTVVKVTDLRRPPPRPPVRHQMATIGSASS